MTGSSGGPRRRHRSVGPSVGPSVRVFFAAAAFVASACGGGQPPTPAPTPQPAADSVRARQAADSMAATSRRDSALAVARRDSAVARARADSVARVERERARADSVRAQVLRDGADPSAAGPVPSGLDPVRGAALSRAIHFDLDRADLTPEATQLLEEKLAILRANPRLEIQIEGHCDERGPDEYNLALGNRRAAAAKRYIVEHGIADARIAIISYGEERPADPGHTEEAWAMNRRAEFVVTRGGR
ncbi:MAG: peptidoglycan-associated lipoprotein Pal [Gemmatimonadales bacterium]|nr:peptidoglycan-associated lipoprotein Pal [Gemmatimonadales bacterium]